MIDATLLIGAHVKHMWDAHQINPVLGEENACEIVTPYLDGDSNPLVLKLLMQGDIFSLDDQGMIFQILNARGIEYTNPQFRRKINTILQKYFIARVGSVLSMGGIRNEFSMKYFFFFHCFFALTNISDS